MYELTLYTMGWSHKRLHLRSPEFSLVDLVKRTWNAPRILRLRESLMEKRRSVATILFVMGVVSAFDLDIRAILAALAARILAEVILNETLR